MNEQTYQDRPTMAKWNEIVAAVGSMPRIAYGSYVGTNEYGSSHPNTLSFDFSPRLIVIYAYFHPSCGLVGMPIVASTTWLIPMDAITTEYRAGYGLGQSGSDLHKFGKKSEDGKSYTWYCTDGSEGQFNGVNAVYYYIAIG